MFTSTHSLDRTETTFELDYWGLANVEEIFVSVGDSDSVGYSEYYEPVYQVLVGDEVTLSVYRSRVGARAHHVDDCQENWRRDRGYSCLFIP